MKNYIFVAGLCLALNVYAAETKKVCVDKAGKPKQNCKEMKVHKKLEGTEVPVKK
jgi:hypothetical protein